MVNERYPNRVNRLLPRIFCSRAHGKLASSKLLLLVATPRAAHARRGAVFAREAALHPTQAARSGTDRGHPLRLRIDRERGGSERDAVRNAGILPVQPFQPFL